MSHDEIKKDYLKKIKLIQKYNQYYYNKNKSAISDYEFDIIKLEVLRLEKKYEFLNNKDSPSKKVGYAPSKNFKKIKHKVPMLSLGNAFNKDDLLNFEKKILNFLSFEKSSQIEFSAEPKIDGISASLLYKNGRFIQGLSRGDGNEGEDITENLKTIKDIPKIINEKNFPSEIDIRGEVFIQNKDFEKLKNKFANPRNAASGSLRQKNPDDTRKIPLKFIAYTFGYEQGLKIENQFEYLKKLNEWGFKTNPLNKLITGVKNLLTNYNEIEKKRSEIDFDIDGIVYKINDFKLQKRLGNVANAPRWAIAHKFSSNKGISLVKSIEIQIGRTGALTPVAKIEPINIGGVLVSNATLHNEDEIDRKDIRVGDTVIVERAGDVIPHILSVELKKRPKDLKKFSFPKKCPSCGSKTIKEFNIITKKNDAVRRCTSEGYECEKISIEKLKHFVSKEALNIDGFGKKIVETFYKLKLIKLPQDIFKLDFKKIESLEGWGKQSVENLKYSINERKKISLERFIYSLGIRHIGLENAKILAGFFQTIVEFKKFVYSNNKKFFFSTLLELDGIGETQIDSFMNFISSETNLKITKKLINELEISDYKIENKNGIFSNKKIMFTGTFKDMSRSEAKSIAENNGGKVLGSVSKKLDYLVVGDTKPTKKKIKQANDLKVKVITEKEWKKFLNS